MIYDCFRYDYIFLSVLDLAAPISAVTRSREQMMREMVGYVLATEVTTVVITVTVLRFGMQVEILARCYFSWVVFVQKQRIMQDASSEDNKIPEVH